MSRRRGQDPMELQRRLTQGKKDEERLAVVLKKLYGVEVQQHPEMFSPYDFNVANNDNVKIEFKSLKIKKVINGEPYQYPYIVIPKIKIDKYIAMRQINPSLVFLYIISLCYDVDGITKNQYKYIALDLDAIVKNNNIVAQLLNTDDFAEHYQLPHNLFQPLTGLSSYINSIA